MTVVGGDREKLILNLTDDNHDNYMVQLEIGQAMKATVLWKETK